MKIRVGIQAFDTSGKRIVDAVNLQPDMEPGGIRASDPNHRRIIREKGFPLVEDPEKVSDVIVESGSPTVVRDVDGAAVTIPGPDLIAIRRILDALPPDPPVNRLFSTIVTGHEHATFDTREQADSLEPVFETDEDLDAVFGEMAPRIGLRRVRAPYTHSNLHMLKIDFEVAVSRDAVLHALNNASRLLVQSAADGFHTTADIQEYCRNLDLPRPERPECFIWEESVLTRSASLMLMVDVPRDAAAVPETIDAVRQVSAAPVSPAESRRRTDEALGLGIPRKGVLRDED